MKTPGKSSPARSQGVEHPIRVKRRTLSVGSDRSAGRLSALIQPDNMESFAFSPLARSILSDNTDIDAPRRISWWKNLGENSRDVIQLLDENKIETNNIIEELDIEVIRQEQKNFTMDLPESSDNESISSIVIPQKRLFSQKDNLPLKDFREIIGKRDTSVKLRKPNTDVDKTINVRTRELFQTKQRSKLIIPAALLDIPQNENIEELDIEALRKEKRNFMDLPESSDSESIRSIVIPQRRLFSQKNNLQPTNFGEIMGKRATLAELHKTDTDVDKTINVRTRELFQTKQRSKQIFPAALLNISPNKTSTDKTELVTGEPRAQVRNIFGNRATKRKNIFSNFIVAESEDEIPEIESKVFNFQMKLDGHRQGSSPSRGIRDSLASSITNDMEMDDWKMLPSSTLVENQLEILIADGNSSKRARLSKLTEIESEAGSNSTKTSNKSVSSKETVKSRKSKTFTKEKAPEVETSMTTRNKSKVFQNDNSEEEFGLNKDDQNKYSNDTEKSRKSKTFIKEKEPEVEISMTTRNESKVSQNDNSEEEFELNKEDQNKYSNDTDKSRKSKTLIKEKAPEVEISMNTRNKSKASQNDDNVEEILGQDQEASRKSKTFTKEKAPELETSMTTRQKSKISQHDEEMLVQNQEAHKSNFKTVDQNLSQSSITTQGINDSPKSNQTVEEECVLNNISKGTNRSMSKSLALNPKDNNVNIATEVLTAAEPADPLAAADQVNDDEINLTLKYDNDHEEIEKVLENIQHYSPRDAQNYQSDVRNEESEVQNEIAIEDSQSQKKANEIVENLNKSETIQDQEEIENPSRNEDEQYESVLLDQSENENDEGDDINESQVAEDVNEEENESLEEQQNDSVVEQNESVVEQNESVVEQNESVVEQNESQDQNERQEQNESQEQQNESVVDQNESQENESEIKRNESQELEVADEEDDFVQNISQEKVEQDTDLEEVAQDTGEEDVEQDTDQDEVEQDTDTEEQNESKTENHDESEAVADSDIENDKESDNNISKDDVANGSDEQVESDPENEEIETTNISHDTTGKNKKNESPEVVLRNRNNHFDSIAVQGRNTSVRKTEIIKSMHIRPSLATLRESTIFSDSTKNSSAEGSGWDSHRTTRKTLRQTFGKDFTPRKSLRALVMEKIAKRQTQINEIASGTAKLPQGNEASVTAKLPQASPASVTANFRQANETASVTAKFPQASPASVTANFRQANETASVTAKFPVANSTELPEMSNRYDDDDDDVENQESNHEVSLRTRQTSLDMYLKEIKKKNAEIRLKIEEEVRNSLKAPPKYIFKVPDRPPPARRKPAAKPRQVSSTIFMGEYSLPAEIIEDMKYKPPKRFQPNDAPWITKRLYKYLETKLEPTYRYKARLRAETLVEHIYQFAREVKRRRDAASPDAVAVLKREMARLHIVKTHFEFYEFFHQFMPRDIRVKVNPDVVNKIGVPKRGVFSDIL